MEYKTQQMTKAEIRKNSALPVPFKIILSNQRFYSEHSLSDERQVVRIGTEENCRLRYPKEWFFEGFSVQLERCEAGWRISCDDKVFFTAEGANKLYKKELKHGDRLNFISGASGQSLFSLQFVHDYDLKTKAYDLVFDWHGERALSIGGEEDCDIVLHDDLIGNDRMGLVSEEGLFYITDIRSANGVYVNGTRIKGRKQIKDYDFFSLLGFSFYYRHGHIYTDSEANMNIYGLNTRKVRPEKNWENYPRFSRNASLVPKIPEEEISILDPPNKPEKMKRNLFTALLPTVLMVAAILMASKFMGGGGQFIIFSVIMMSMGIVTTIVGFIEGHFTYKKDSRKRIVKYNEYLERKYASMDQVREEENEILRLRSIGTEEEAARVLSFSPELFDRRDMDEDFMKLHLGIGRVKSERQIEYRKKEFLDYEDELQDLPEETQKKYEYLNKAPLTLDLKELSVVGISGGDKSLCEFMRNLSLDLVTRQFQSDLKLAFLVSPEMKKTVYWARLLPHVKKNGTSLRSIACDDRSMNDFLEELYRELSMRESLKRKKPALVIFIVKDQTIQGHPVSNYMKKGKELGVCFIFLENSRFKLPPTTESFIRLCENEQTGQVLNTRDSFKTASFVYENFAEGRAEELGKILAPVYEESLSLENRLTSSISLFRLLNIYTTDDLDIGKNWNESRVDKSLSVPIGVMVKNETIALDIHEKAHGPHGLVAGTTGSGKSELLQTYIVSAALRFHPDDFAIMIIDFKGGGMANQFKKLPHLIGTITNIEGREVNRSLKSIKAELIRRQKLFAEIGVNHIDKYISAYKRGEAKLALPHLVLIVDEFAELKQEQPDFMKELISAARIGRSLGVHLILATQKPSGVVDEQIWSNSKFRICLKVQNKADSNEVIKSPLAAEIVEPGRAYLSVGNDEIFELFQSAYGGVSEKSDILGEGESFKIHRISLSGYPELVYEKKKKKDENSGKTQQEALINYIASYADKHGVRRLPAIVLPPLDDVIDYPAATDKEKSELDIRKGVKVPVGIFDRPEIQIQEKFFCEITGGHLLVMGSPQFGKSNFLQTIIRGIAERYTQKQVILYLFDFAAMALRNFASLKHVAGVVTASDEEKLRHFRKLIELEMIRRKQLLLEANAGSFAAYLEAGLTDLPQIVLIIDNFANFKELYLEDEDWMLPIIRDGIGLGISVIIANGQTAGFGYKYLANFHQRFGLTMNDSSEYSSLFDKAGIKPKSVPGRALYKLENEINEIQIYRTFQGEREIDRSHAMLGFVEKINNSLEGPQARQIPEMPSRLTRMTMKEAFETEPLDGLRFSAGISFNEVEALKLKLEQLYIFGIAGEDEKRLMLSRSFIRTLCEKPELVKLWIMDDVNRNFGEFSKNEAVVSYSIFASDVKEVLSAWKEEAEKRFAKVSDKGLDALEDRSMCVMVLENKEAMAVIDSDSETQKIFSDIIDKYRSMRFLFIVTNTPFDSIQYSAPSPLKAVKAQKRIFLTEEIGRFNAFDIPYQAARENRQHLEKEDAFYIDGAAVTRFRFISEDRI